MRRFTFLAVLACVTFGSAGRPAFTQPAEPSGHELREIDQDPRPPRSDEALRDWLRNMVWHHGFSIPEIRQSTGMDTAEITAALRRFEISRATRPALSAEAPLQVFPYPGGRHPRVGFLDGAIRPQRETKISVFTPWDRDSYVVVDVPEAIWSNLGLIYLAHTHVPTYWTEQNIALPRLEWQRNDDGSLRLVRALPNGIVVGSHVVPRVDHVQLEMWLTNNTPQTLTDLRVQNCVMLKGARGFRQQTNDNKVLEGSYAACRSADGNRWIITAWDPIHRTWANPPCPCLHADPRFADCEPGQTKGLRGWLSFYEGRDIHAELARIERTGWRRRPFAGNVQEMVSVTGRITDAGNGRPIPARLHVQDTDAQATGLRSKATRRGSRWIWRLWPVVAANWPKLRS